MGSTWYNEWKGPKETFLPDQRGCLELEAGFGGTLAVPYESDNIPGLFWGMTREEGAVREHLREGTAPVKGSSVRPGEKLYPLWYPLKPASHHNQLRVGCAKTKGKFRVVTMQAALTKRLLRPVHEAAYDYISSFGWCVRGDIKGVHLFPLLLDKRDNEKYISGDYEAATDNLNPDAVLAVVEVLAESLPEELGKVLIDSFTDIWFAERKNNQEIRRSVLRGSMMGNLCSFVVLCLLNKICHEITVDEIALERGDSSMHSRLVRINGDDIAFCGDDGVFRKWRNVTSRIGFVVNEKKTGVSEKIIELNSQPFLVSWFDSKR